MKQITTEYSKWRFRLRHPCTWWFTKYPRCQYFRILTEAAKRAGMHKLRTGHNFIKLYHPHTGELMRIDEHVAPHVYLLWCKRIDTITSCEGDAGGNATITINGFCLGNRKIISKFTKEFNSDYLSIDTKYNEITIRYPHEKLDELYDKLKTCIEGGMKRLEEKLLTSRKPFPIPMGAPFIGGSDYPFNIEAHRRAVEEKIMLSREAFKAVDLDQKEP